MLAVISPAKKMDFDLLDPQIEATLPMFPTETNQLITAARKLSVGDLQTMMKISEDLAKLNRERFKAFSKEYTDENSKPAGFAFNGDTYQGLQIEQFDADDLAYAQDHLRILSGLYGTLRPLDRIQPYRLEMGRKMETKRGNTLYNFWGDKIGNALDAAADGAPIINLASNEYFKAAGKGLQSPVITPAFKEERGNDLKMIGFFAKKARGMMARYMIQNRIEDAGGLKAFDYEGYGFREDLSGETDWVFSRES